MNLTLYLNLNLKESNALVRALAYQLYENYGVVKEKSKKSLVKK